ncbi:alpha-amylase family glycosyl hydrolase [Microbulbifer sp. CAU 1566]|uniref:alpha-amylase family glycosyl hydrolase n=1 Tax=Microbulbifer sp. CAU 1566 TaxID=2933269 RepID=UPI0020041FB8|nr:alpha-amylase family glycosyl hydrolase [Microbulbifer sp. CAU 1566]MCK7598610.1 alpha-amylase family glycosyl hydrolase [Microbulbifer sp. CAU 1566]
MELQFHADPSLLPRAVSGGVRFIYDAAPGVSTVALAGTFNSWVGDACMLERVSVTRWQTTLPIPAGRHLYKFVIDGEDWIVDPANPWISEDGQNNSCLTVNETGEVLIRQHGLSESAPGPLYARPSIASPDWLRDGVIYQLSVPAFGGDFDGVRTKLGYLSELGVDVLWIMPVHPIGIVGRRGALGDPYAVRDFDAIDAALGDDVALRTLVHTAHERGMRVILDWTLNRSSVDHPFTRTHPHWYTRRADGSIYYAVPNREYFAGFDFSGRKLRRYLIDSMRKWIELFDIDGLRFDDSDITPRDFLDQIRTELAAVRPDIALISQAYDEFHHLAACDLTYEGGTREMLRRCVRGEVDNTAFARYWNESTYSFPRGALRMRWLEEKEQGRISNFLGHSAHRPAAVVQLTMDGVPHILMGQEFAESTWTDWAVLFDPYQLKWSAFDSDLYTHYQTLIRLRRSHSALRSGCTDFPQDIPAGCIGFIRRNDSERIVVLVNMSAKVCEFDSQFTHAKPLYAHGWDGVGVTLSPYGWMIGAIDLEQ